MGEKLSELRLLKKIASGSSEKHINETVFAVLEALKTPVASVTAGHIVGRRVFERVARLGGVTLRM